MANIYVLQGSGGSGKTPTLKILCKELIQKYKNPNAHIINMLSPNKDVNSGFDIEYIIILGDTRGIGIISHGDEPERLKKCITYFLKANCEIIFCACHPSGKTKAVMRAFMRKHTVVFIDQDIENAPAKQKQSNTKKAQQLINQAGL